MTAEIAIHSKSKRRRKRMEMRLAAVIFAFVLASAAAEETTKSDIPDEHSSRSFVKDLLLKVMKEIEGEKDHFWESIEIAKDSRLEKVGAESFVDKIALDVEDLLPTVIIRNLTVPVKLLQVKGLYTFEDLTLPGGLTIYGNGEFTIRVEQLKLFLFLNTRHNSGSALWTVKDVAIDASMKSCLIRFDNLMNGEPMGDFLHKMINQLIPVAVELLSGLVQENKEAVMRLIAILMNKFLSDESLA